MTPLRLPFIIAVVFITPPLFTPDWPSLNSRPNPEWYDASKIGILLNWGIYSVPGFGTEDLWLHLDGDRPNQTYIDQIARNYPPKWTYRDFAAQFTAELYNPTEWASLCKAAGAKYVIITAKSRDGFALWPSPHSFNWNARELGPKQDIVGSLADAVRDQDLRFGVHHSLDEFFNPLYLADKANDWNTTYMPDLKVMPEMVDLIERYDPDLFWSDGNCEAPDTYWKSEAFLAWLFTQSEDIAVNDRWGADSPCQNGGVFTCKDARSYFPEKWEKLVSLDKKARAFRSNVRANEVVSIEELVATLAETVSYGGNLLINVGPSKEGLIGAIFQERLLQLGEWLDLNGEAIYESTPWRNAQKDRLANGVWYTEKGGDVYGIVLNWPDGKDGLVLGSMAELVERGDVQVKLMGYDGENLQIVADDDKVKVVFPNKNKVKGEWGWVLKFTSSKWVVKHFSSI